MRRSTIIFLTSLILLVSGSAAILAYRFGWSQSPELTLCVGHASLSGGMFLLGVACSLRWPPPKDGPLYDTPALILTKPSEVPASRLYNVAFPACASRCIVFKHFGPGDCPNCRMKFDATGNPITQAELDRLCG